MSIPEKCFLLLCTLFFAHAPKVLSQTPQLSLTTFNSANGLSQNTINCCFKDRFGLMWFGTQDGLNMYDGYKVKVFKHRNNDKKSLPANHITAIAEDASGNLWIGTRLGGLSKYDRAQETFVNYKHNSSDPYSISNNSITCIYLDKQAGLWIGTEAGLNHWSASGRNFKRYVSNINNKNALSHSTITALYEDTNQNLWVGTANGLNSLNRSKGVFTRFLEKETTNNHSRNYINVITQDQYRELWMGTSAGLKMLNVKNNTFVNYSVEPDKNSADGINPVFAIARNGERKLWLGTNTTLQLFDVDSRKLIPVSDRTAEDKLMPNDGIYTLLADATGILWIGTTSQGILKYNKNLPIFPAYKSSLTSIPSAQNIIRGVAEDEKGNLYLATDFGVDYFNRRTCTYRNYQHSKTQINSLLSNYTTSVIVSKKSHLVWIATYNSGLDCLNPETGTFKHYLVGSKHNQLSTNSLDVLLEDHNGTIWIGTADAGLNSLDTQTGTFTRYPMSNRNTNGVCDKVIQALYEDSKGNIWIGGYSNGITIYNPSQNTFKQLNTSNSKLNSNVISAFYEDSDGQMWIGTMEGGLNCYNPVSGKINAYTEQSGLVNNTINYVTADRYGFIWLGTNSGIVRFDSSKKQFKNFTFYNGLKTLEFNLGAGAKLSNGEVIIGGINGLNVINPAKLQFNNNKPKVLITGLELFNKPAAIRGKRSSLKQSILSTSTIILKHHQSVFTLEFAALDYTVPEENQYAYRLNGFDADWRYVGSQRKATYTNLNPGKYTFQVKAANNDGVWSDHIATLTIIIEPPFWMTWWFRTLCVVLLLSTTYVIYRSRVKFLSRQKIELKKQVKQRTHEISIQAQELRQLNHELQSQAEELQAQSEELQAQSEELWSKTKDLELLNEQLTNQKAQEQKARLMAERLKSEADQANRAKSTFLATMSHEIRTPMNGVLGMASLLSETKLDVEQREYTDAILNSGESLLNVINDVLDFSKIESGNLELDNHDFELRKCVEDVLELFSAKTSRSGIDLIYHIDDSIPLHLFADSFRLRQVLTNIVSNATKFTHQGEIFVEVSLGQLKDELMEVCFEVRDTGIGIPKDQLSNLFKAFNQIDSSISRKYGGSGLGLAICQRLVSLMGGNITVESEPGKGSSFKFNIECRTGKNKSLAEERINAAIYEFKKVLIVDDNHTNLRILSKQLQKRKMVVTAVSSGKEALAILSSSDDVDLMITDMQMPDMDGVSLSKRVKTTHSSLPIILLSSIGDDTKREHPDLFTAVLTKPVRQQQLYKLVSIALSNNQSIAELPKKSILSEDFAVQYPYKMLVAEDNLMNQKLILRVLNKLGYQPDLANDGREVLSKASQTNYDIILMDVQMPHLDGLEATRKIRQEYGSKPLILAMTANAMSEDKDHCLEAGMNGYMSKPIRLELLVDNLKAMYNLL